MKFKSAKKLLTFILFASLLIVACLPPPDPKIPPPPAEIGGADGGEISLDKNFYIVFDGSGSMGERGNAGKFGNRIEGAKWAAKEFVVNNVPTDVNLGLYAFDNNKTGERVSLGKNNRDKIIAEVDKMQSGGGTPLNDAVKKGTAALVVQRNKQLGYGEFYLVVITDGEAGDGDMKNSVDFAQKNSIIIITIGFGLDKAHALSKDSLSYRNATNPDELLQALQATQGESPYYDSASFKK